MLEVSGSEEMIFNSEGGQNYFLLSSSHNWEISNGVDWCEISHANRKNQSGNDILVVVSVDGNPELSIRETSVVITSEGGKIIEKK